MRPLSPGSRARVADLGRHLWREWKADRASGLAAEVAFFGLLSIFPMLLALAAALGSMEAVVGTDLVDAARQEVVDFLHRMLSNDAEPTVRAVDRLFRTGDAGVFTVAMVVSLWSASRGFVALVRAVNIVYDIDEVRSALRVRGVALLLALGTVVVTTAMLALLVLGPLLGTGRDVADALGAGEGFALVWTVLRWPVAIGIITGWATTVLHVAPNHSTPWRSDLPGAVACAVLWALLSVSLRAYLGLAGASNEIFGILGGALVVVVWLYLLAIGLLLGGELNAVLRERPRSALAVQLELPFDRTRRGPDSTAADLDPAGPVGRRRFIRRYSSR